MVTKRWFVIVVATIILFGITSNQNTNVMNGSNQNTKIVVGSKKSSPEINKKSQPDQLVAGQFPSRPPVVRKTRSPASYVKRKHTHKKIEVSLSENPIRIGKSFKVVDGVSTLEKDKYDISLGKKISESNTHVFFVPTSSATEAWPVALDSTNQKLYPISHILHVKGVDSDLRAQFKAEGMQEYFYQSRLKFMFLETSPSTVIKQFQNLTDRGFDVRLEVLKETPQSK